MNVVPAGTGPLTIFMMVSGAASGGPPPPSGAAKAQQRPRGSEHGDIRGLRTSKAGRNLRSGEPSRAAQPVNRQACADDLRRGLRLRGGERVGDRHRGRLDRARRCSRSPRVDRSRWWRDGGRPGRTTSGRGRIDCRRRGASISCFADRALDAPRRRTARSQRRRWRSR